MDKAELMETIRRSHRQLMRYLFYFEKNSDGEFAAGSRPKFAIDEMMQPGVFGDWSLKDLLSHLVYREQRFLGWYQSGLKGETPKDLPSSDHCWDVSESEDLELSTALRSRSIQRTLDDMKGSYQDIIAQVTAIPEEALFYPGYYEWTDENTLADYLAFSTYLNYEWAKKHIRLWRKVHAGQYLNKQVILERIQSERRRLEKNLEQLTDLQIETEEVIGDWTVKDVLAHLSEWEKLFIGWYKTGVRGEIPEVPAPGISWQNIDVLNQSIYEKYHRSSIEDIRRDFNESYKEILATIEAMSEEEMFAVGRYPWLGNGNLVGYILANTANHYRWAKREIRSWLISQGQL
jgi:hypothetical protein